MGWSQWSWRSVRAAKTQHVLSLKTHATCGNEACRSLMLVRARTGALSGPTHIVLRECGIESVSQDGAHSTLWADDGWSAGLWWWM